jgi:hypothetical protein
LKIVIPQLVESEKKQTHPSKKKTMPYKQLKSEIMVELQKTTIEAVENYVQYADQYAEELGDGTYLKVMENLKNLHDFLNENEYIYEKHKTIQECWETLSRSSEGEFFTPKGLHFLNSRGGGNKAEVNMDEAMKRSFTDSEIFGILDISPANFGVYNELKYEFLSSCAGKKDTYILKKTDKVSKVHNAYFFSMWGTLLKKVNNTIFIYDFIRNMFEDPPKDKDDVKLAVIKCYCLFWQGYAKEQGDFSEFKEYLKFIKKINKTAYDWKSLHENIWSMSCDENTMRIIRLPQCEDAKLIIGIVELIKELWNRRDGNYFPVPRQTMAEILHEADTTLLKLTCSALTELKRRGTNIPSGQLRGLFIQGE